MLRITQDIIDKIIIHGRSEAPLEACGYLAQKDGIVCRHIEMKNVDASPVHYSMDPAQQFEVVRTCRKEGLTIRAAYHSHPDTPARPSAEDIKLAYDPSLSYVIISLAEANAQVKSFIIEKDRVLPEEIDIIEVKKMTTTITADVFQDLRGVGCPMNLVKTKFAFSRMQSGQILGLVLDDGPPINNVPRSVVREGHEILSRDQLDDGTWSVLIRKA
jgi:proteasome lid subunit RPN8/RPN11/TusA-related sulfurtransferase